MGAHRVERIFAVRDDPERHLDALITVTAHALDGEEPGDQEIAVEFRYGLELAPAEDDPAALACRVDRAHDARWAAGGAIDDEVCHVAAGDVANRVAQVLLVDIDSMGRAKLSRQCEPTRVDA